MQRFFTIKQNERSVDEVLEYKKLEDNSLWFRIKYHKSSGKNKTIAYIMDFNIHKDGIDVIKANGSPEDGYVWIEQNILSIAKFDKNLTYKVREIWDNVYGDIWPLDINNIEYSHLSFPDILYLWQVLVIKPNLTLLAKELGWYTIIADLNYMKTHKYRAAHGSSLATTYGYRQNSVISLRSNNLIKDIDGTNVKRQLDLTHVQYKKIKELQLNSIATSWFIKFCDNGVNIELIYELFKSKLIIINEDTTRMFMGCIRYIKNNDNLSESVKRVLISTTIFKRVLSGDIKNIASYLMYLKDWLNMNLLLFREFVPSDIPKVNEYVTTSVPDRRISNGMYIITQIPSKVLKIKVLHDNLLKEYRIKKDEIIVEHFNKQAIENIKIYEKTVDDYSFIVPRTVEELHDEGKLQNHCVATYCKSVANNISAIVFMRKTNDIKEPLITIEVKGNTLYQAKGYSNREATESENKVINKWLKLI